MSATEKQSLLARLDALRQALEQEPTTPVVTQALHQCERLHQAILQWHAEGLRFAAFTLNRLTQQPGTNLHESTQAAAQELKRALDASGYQR
jgi:hypothetical protein